MAGARCGQDGQEIPQGENRVGYNVALWYTLVKWRVVAMKHRLEGRMHGKADRDV
jgi:hypothetical protein